MKSNKGFTLIELLAVIVVLAIIALIAVPMVLNTIEDARKGAKASSALAYIAKVEEQIAINMIYGTDAPETITNANFTTDIKGEKPSSVNIVLSNGVVTTGTTLCIDGYKVTYDGSNAVAEKDTTSCPVANS